MQLKLHKPTMVIGYSLRMCTRNVNSTNPGRSNLVFRSKPIPEAQMSNRLIATCQTFRRELLCEIRPSHLRRAIVGPSKRPVWRGSVGAICGPPRRQMAKRRRLVGDIHVYLPHLLAFVPSIARL